MKLQSFPAALLPLQPLFAVHSEPLTPIHKVNTAHPQGAEELVFGGFSWLPPDCPILNQMTNGLNRISFGVANEPNWTALDPARAVKAGYRRTQRINHSALLIGNDTQLAIEGNSLQLTAKVANGPIDRLHTVFDQLSSPNNIACPIKLGSFESDRGDSAVLSKHLDRGVEEV
jgi:hypothetical protein